MDFASLLETLFYFLGFLLIAEGIVPFFFPERYRFYLVKMLSLEAPHLQKLGGLSILFGSLIVLLLFFI